MAAKIKRNKEVLFLFGYAGAGKDYTADYLIKNGKIKTEKFSCAEPVKEIAYKLGWDGVKDKAGRELLNEITSKYRYDYKQAYKDGIYEDYFTRDEFLKLHRNVSLWTNILVSKIMKSETDHCIITDIRWIEEYINVISTMSSLGHEAHPSFLYINGDTTPSSSDEELNILLRFVEETELHSMNFIFNCQSEKYNSKLDFFIKNNMCYQDNLEFNLTITEVLGESNLKVIEVSEDSDFRMISLTKDSYSTIIANRSEAIDVENMKYTMPELSIKEKLVEKITFMFKHVCDNMSAEEIDYIKNDEIGVNVYSVDLITHLRTID